MAEAEIIENLDDLQGEHVWDAEGRDMGEIQSVYGIGEDGVPMWITLDTSEGIASKRTVFVPMARLKREQDRLCVPYSVGHLQASPEVETAEQLTDEQERALRDYYAVDLADTEQRTDNISYAAQVPEGDGPAHRLDAS